MFHLVIPFVAAEVDCHLCLNELFEQDYDCKGSLNMSYSGLGVIPTTNLPFDGLGSCTETHTDETRHHGTPVVL